MEERMLSELLETHAEGIKALSESKIYDLLSHAEPALLKQIDAILIPVFEKSSKFLPNIAQIDRVKANVLGFLHGRIGILDGIKQRCGKTPIGLLTVYVLDRLNKLKHRRVIITCPPTPGAWKWVKEIHSLFGDEVRAYSLDKDPIRILSDLRCRAHHPASKLEIYVLGHVKLRTSYRTVPIKEMRKTPEQLIAKLPSRERSEEWDAKVMEHYRVQSCPSCGSELRGKHGLPLHFGKKSRVYCPECNEALYQPRTEAGGSFHVFEQRVKQLNARWREAEDHGWKHILPSFPLADEQKKYRFNPAGYINRYLTYRFDLWISDELHELKAGKSSGQGIEGLRLSQNVKARMGLTGTPSDGKARNLFYLNWMLFPQKMVELGFKFKDLRRWIKTYGILEEFETIPVENGVVTNKKVTHHIRELAGLDKRVMADIYLPNMITGHLREFFADKFSYTEQLHIVQLDPDQEEAYENFAMEAKHELVQALLRHDHSRLASYFQSLYSCLDHCHDGRSMVDPYNADEVTGEKRVLAHFPALGPQIWPKEQKLIESVQQYHNQGHKVLIYCEDTRKVDITGRLKWLLEKELGLSFYILTDTKTEGREERINKMMADGMDGMLCNPKRVKTGSDFPWATRIQYFQTPLSTFVLDQGSQRGLGIYQTRACQSDFYMYGGTVQSLQAEKQALKKYEMDLFTGLLPQGFARGLDNSNDSLLEALAKAFVQGKKTNDEALAVQWAEAREVNIAQEEEVSQAEIVEFPEPEIVDTSVIKETTKLIGESLVETKIFREEPENPKRPIFGEIKVQVRRRRVKAPPKTQMGFNF